MTRQAPRGPRRHRAATRGFHWLIAALILVQIPLAYYMIGLPLSPDKFGKYALHKSLGMLIFGVTVLRLAWRWARPPPALTGAIWQRTVARITHALLYVITLVMPLTGWIGSSARNFPVSIFGYVQLPDLVAPDKQLHESLTLVHRGLAWTLFALLALHVGAAIYHHLVRRDDVLTAMVPWSGRRRGDGA